MDVVQQSGNNVSFASFASVIEEVATQISKANDYEVSGKLANKFTSGRQFFNIKIDKITEVVFEQ